MVPPAKLKDTEGAQRIRCVTEQGRHLTEDEHEQSRELHSQFREEIEHNPRMLQVYRHAFGCLEVKEQEVVRIDAETRAWRDDANKKRIERADLEQARIAEMKRKKEENLRKKAAEEAKYAPRKSTPGKKLLQGSIYWLSLTSSEATSTPAPQMPPPVLPVTAPAEPPSGPQGVKRHASDALDPPPPPKIPKYDYKPAAGDWKCGRCLFWHARVLVKCKFKHPGGEICGIAKSDPAFKHEVQEKGYGADLVPGAAKYLGDWRCGDCRCWNDSHRPNCRLCGVDVATCKDAEDFDENLDHPDHYYEDSGKTY